MVAKQDNIVPPEKKTPAYQLINLSAGSTLNFKKRQITINLQIKNLLNKKYWNHTSYYRLIDVPEPGRNIILSLKYTLNK